MKRKIISLMLTLAVAVMVMQPFCGITAVAEELSVWDGTTASSYAGGSGTDTDPYLISNGAELAKLVGVDYGEATAGKYYKLTNDIYLNDESTSNPWEFSTSIWCEYSFRGNFDGDGHVIYGIRINNSEDGRMGGLFQSLSGTVTIKNLGIMNSEISFTGSDSYAGALAGAADGDFTISQCFVDESVSIYAKGEVAGFVGNVGCNRSGHTLNINNSYSLAVLDGASERHGLFGYNWEAYSGSVSCVYTVDHDLFKNDFTGSLINVENEYSNVQEHNWYDRHTNLFKKDYMQGNNAKEYFAGFDFDTVWSVKDDNFAFLKIFSDKFDGEETEPYTGTPGEVWDGSVADCYNGGDGSQDSPYLISTAAQLARLVSVDLSNTEGKYYKLTDDIILNDENTSNLWEFSTSIWCEYAFKGTFDGDGHVVSGININNSEADRMGGLFPALSGTATVKNLGIINSSINFTGSGSFAGALAGGADGDFTISQCFVSESVSVSATGEVAGFIGNVGCNRTGHTLNINNSYSLAVLDGADECHGLFGYNWQTYSGSVSCVYTLDHDLFKNDMTGSDINIEYEYSDVQEHNWYDRHANLWHKEYMRGDDAKEFMGGFDFDTVWDVKANKYPYLRIFGDKYADGVECTHDQTSTVPAVVSTCCTQGHDEYEVCDICGETVSGSDAALPLDPDNHYGGEEIRNASDPTCTAPGYTGDTYCLGCGKIKESGSEIPVTSIHTTGDWLSDENSHWHFCTVCEQNVDTVAHTYEWVVTKAATAEESGLQEEMCSVCGYKTGNSKEVVFVVHIPGDISGDGSVNNKDLARLFQYLSGWDVEVNEPALDINGDGKVNNKDLTRLFQHLSNWDVDIF